MTSRPVAAARLSRFGRRMLKFGLVMFLGLMLLAETLAERQDVAVSWPHGRWMVWLSAALTALFALGVLLWFRPGRKRWIGYAALVSIILSVVVLVADVATAGVIEGIAFLVLMLFAVRHWDATPGRWVAFAVGVAALLLPVRYYGMSEATFAAAIPVTLSLSTVVGFGAYLRGLDKLRRETQEEVRRAERLELAREMHDFVAHHVTGMVVLAQAAQVTDTDPRKSFADIEEAGLAALASMRRMVKVLRADDNGAGLNPLGDLAQIDDLVERFAREGTDASCFISPELAEKVSPEIAATAHRVVRESLTNVRKHAKDGKQVRVVVAAAGTRGLEVSVRDDGRGARKRLAATGGGMGLLGLRERVEAVGGHLRAEPRPEGGWEVVAWLPHAAPTDGD